MDAHAIQHRHGLDAVADFGDSAGAIEPAGDDLDAVTGDAAALHRREGMAPGAQHLLGVSKSLGRVAMQSAVEEVGQPVPQQRVEPVHRRDGILFVELGC